LELPVTHTLILVTASHSKNSKIFSANDTLCWRVTSEWIP
jgi:hypothetical protein